MAEEKDSTSIPLSAAGGVDGGIDPEDPAKSPPTSPISTRRVRAPSFSPTLRFFGCCFFSGGDSCDFAILLPNLAEF